MKEKFLPVTGGRKSITENANKSSRRRQGSKKLGYVRSTASRDCVRLVLKGDHRLILSVGTNPPTDRDECSEIDKYSKCRVDCGRKLEDEIAYRALTEGHAIPRTEQASTTLESIKCHQLHTPVQRRSNHFYGLNQ